MLLTALHSHIPVSNLQATVFVKNVRMSEHNTLKSAEPFLLLNMEQQ